MYLKADQNRIHFRTPALKNVRFENYQFSIFYHPKIRDQIGSQKNKIQPKIRHWKRHSLPPRKGGINIGVWQREVREEGRPLREHWCRIKTPDETPFAHTPPPPPRIHNLHDVWRRLQCITLNNKKCRLPGEPQNQSQKGRGRTISQRTIRIAQGSVTDSIIL